MLALYLIKPTWERYNITKTITKPKICILLTMYCMPKRVKLYKSVARKWVDTGLPVFIIDSYGTGLDDVPNVTQGIFKQNQSFVHFGPSLVEKESIVQALNLLPELKSYDLIFKVTGKYYLPDFSKILDNIPRDIEIVLQNQTVTHGQNSEIFGIKPKLMHKVLDSIDNNTTMELALFNTCKEYKCYRMPPLIPDKKIKRGDNQSLDYL
jgi:hypothetical protein